MEITDITSQKLLVAWEDVTGSLSRFTDILREIKDCQDMEITFCLRNGSRVDAYSVPDKTLNGGNDVPPMVTQRDNETATILSSTAPENQLLHEISHYLQSCNIKQVRSFLTNVRKRLNIKTFDWPEAAKTRFIAEMKVPLPSAPGRANSGKKLLLHMLKLSVEVDDAWKTCVREVLNMPEPSKTAHENVASNQHNSRDLMNQNQDANTGVQDLGRTQERANYQLSDCEHPMIDDDHSITPEIIEMARVLPRDGLKVTVPRNAWVFLPAPISNISYPSARPGNDWFIQPMPGDGNCMFSAILVTAKMRGCLPAFMDSVAKMRSSLRDELLELSRSGEISRKYRRDWLASCLHDVDDRTVERHCYQLLEEVADSYFEADMEKFLAPLRVLVSNWAKMVGGEHWGGLLRAELFILATKCGVVIEGLQPSTKSSTAAPPLNF